MAAFQPTSPTAMSDRLNRTSICSVIFINIVDYAQAPVNDQIAQKQRFNALINEAVKDVAQNDRIILDTGDGAALALLGAPEEALFVALGIRDSVLQDSQQHPDRPYSIRLGINLGPVRVVNDLNGMLNVVGDGINAAQRVMSFAAPNQLLVSRSYYEIASRLSSEIAAMFSYFGVKTDKYVREHEVYVVLDGNAPPVEAFDTEPAPMGEVPAATMKRWSRIWVAMVLGVLLVALIWGLWIKWFKPVPPSIRDTVTEVEKERAAARNSEAATTQEQSAAEKPATAPTAKKSSSHRTRAETSSVTREAAKKQRSEADCSDAQRMLKQCN